jgi:CheY-like chemotaxis protein
MVTARAQNTLKGVSFIIADSNVYFSSLLFSMLKGFGADKIIQARDAQSAAEALETTKLDAMLCDFLLPPNGGMAFVRSVRLDRNAAFRKIPALFMTSDTRISIIKAARDTGANMVITKPLSPKGLYDRLSWVAFDTRPFVETRNYYGPDRRFKIEGFPDGQGRRKGDKPVEIAEDSGPGLSQNEIDSLFADARSA